jgi:hypothetical protein
MQHFIPSDTPPALRLLRQAFPTVPLAVARAAVEQYTQPGDVILDPFVSGLGVIQAALDLKRSIVAASFNPINALAIQATLWPGDARAALTHLADTPKGSLRLRDHLRALYTTRCPTCGRDALAQHFMWDRDRNAPSEKYVNCTVCGENVGQVDADDLTKLKRYDPRGLAFWALHGRMIDRQHEDADRVSEVVEAYTPRTQAALSDILSKFEALSEEDRAALRPALLATFDTCSTLHTPDESRYPSGLKPPARFIERNVWLEFERQVSLFPTVASAVPRVATVDDLLAANTPAVCLLILPARELVKHLPAHSLPLMVTHPPLPRPGFWSLSAVWAAWLWGKQDYRVDALRPLLSRKRTSWDWQWRAIGSALSVLQPALRSEARTVMAFPADEAILESVLLAAASAHDVVDHLTCDPHDGVRVTWRPHPLALSPERSGERERPVPSLTNRSLSTEEALGMRHGQQGEATVQLLPSPENRSLFSGGGLGVRHILLDRAEPTSTLMLKAGLLAAWGQTSTLIDIAHQPDGESPPLAVLRAALKSALEDRSLFEIEPQTWWLHAGSIDQAPLARTPLADRLERVVVDLLRAQADWHTIDLLREVYRRFPDQLTPDRALLATTIHSYAEEFHFDRVRLRAEDQTTARAVEVQEVSQLLAEMGQRLGFETIVTEQTVEWLKSTTFVLQTTAEIEPLLHSASGVLVIPGGRATLLQVKLARDARLRETHWPLLKFSSLRRAAQQPDLTLQTFQLAFGLEPPIEQPATQIQLL